MTEKVMTIILVCPVPEEVSEDMLSMEGLPNENSTKARSIFIAALVFSIHLVEQLSSEREGHDVYARMSNSRGDMRGCIVHGGPFQRKFDHNYVPICHSACFFVFPL